MTAIVGIGRLRSASSASRIVSRKRAIRLSSSRIAAKSARSAPAQKPPSPVTISSRASPSSPSSRVSSAQPASGMALRASGRLEDEPRDVAFSDEPEHGRGHAAAGRVCREKKTGLPVTRQPGRIVPRRPVRWRREAAGECRHDHNRASTRRRRKTQGPCQNGFLRLTMVNGPKCLCRSGIGGSAKPGLGQPPAGMGGARSRRRRGRDRPPNSNRPKQVAPEPDMRANAGAGEGVEHVPDLRHQRDGGRFEVVAARPASRRAARGRSPSQPREHGGGRERPARIDEQDRRSGQIFLERLELVAPAVAARGLAEEAGRDVGAERGGEAEHVLVSEAPHPRDQPQRRRRVGRAAAEPRGERQFLVEREGDARAEHGARRAARDCRARRRARARTAR